MTDRYDETYAKLDGIPGVTMATPTTVEQSVPFLGKVSTVSVRLARVDEQDDAGRITRTALVLFLTYQDSDGAFRLVLPDRAVKAIVRQHERLFERSTPASRQRRSRRRELLDKREQDHRAGRHEHRALKTCPLCN